MKLVRTLTAVALVAAVLAGSVPAASAGAPSLRQRPSLSQRAVLATQNRPASDGSPASFSTTGSPIPTDRVLVRLKDSATPQALASIGKHVNASTRDVAHVTHDRLQWRVPKGRSAIEFAQELENSGQVDYAVPDYQRRLAYTPPAYVPPNDPAVATYPLIYAWWMHDIRVFDAWAEGYTGPSIVGKFPLRAPGNAFTVAVLDSGLYGGSTPSHPDEGVNIVGGVDFFDRLDANNNLVMDGDVTPVPWTSMPASLTERERRLIASHGTCVAGEIGMTVRNAEGGAGVGYDTNVVVHKVMGRLPDGEVTIDDAAVVEAIFWSVDNTKAKVISMSFGGYDYSRAIADAVAYAHAHNVAVVAAKGNDGSGAAFYPADNNYVVSVGALDQTDSGKTVPAFFSNYRATSRDIMAPGAYIFAPTDPSWDPLYGDVGVDLSGYNFWDGTSMAAPIVAGAIAWLWRAAPALSADEIESELFASARYSGPTTHYPNGYRSLDMYAAYKKLEADYPLLTKPAISPQTVASLGSVVVGWPVALAHQRGVTYNVAVDGSAVATGTTGTYGRFPWTNGDFTVSATAHSAYNWDDGTASNSATVHVQAPAAGQSAWSGAHVTGSSATAVTVGYHQSAGIEAALTDASSTPLAGAPVRLQASSNGVNWSDVSASVVELPDGVYRSAAAPESKTYYRLASATSGNVTGTVSSAISVLPGVWITTPASKSSISHRSKLTVTGKLKPAHGTSSRYVKLKFMRWNGHAWSTYGTSWTRVTYRGGYSTYSARVKLRKAKYRVYAISLADSKHAATTSGYKSVTVK